MPITASDIWYENALGTGDNFSTYGTLSGNIIFDNVAGELFDKLEASLFVTGGVKKKKAHLRVGSTDPANIYLGVSGYTSVPSGVVVALYAGADQYNGVYSAGGPMVVGALNADLTSGATSVQLALAGNKNLSYFSGWSNGSVLGVYPSSGTPVYLTTTGTPTQITPPNIYQFNLSAAYSGTTIPAGTFGGQVYNISSSPNIVVNNYSSASINNAAIVIGPRGIVQDTITLTFSSSTDFDINSVLFGLVGSGSILTPTTIVNPTTGEVILTIPSSAWSGTANSGETVVIDTYPSALPFFVGIDIPSGTTEGGVIFSLTHDVL